MDPTTKKHILLPVGPTQLSGVYGAPFVDVRIQRFVGHQLNASLAARAFYLRELAFVEDCRVQKIGSASP